MDSLHQKIHSVIGKIKNDKRERLKKVKTTSTVVKPDSLNTDGAVAQIPGRTLYDSYRTSQYQIQTLGQQYQMQTQYRQQLEQQARDAYDMNKLSYMPGAPPNNDNYAILGSVYGRTGQSQDEIIEEERKKLRHQQQIELRVKLLMEEQKKRYLKHDESILDIREMKALEKATRTMWIGNLSEMIQEFHVKENCKLYGDVISVNILRTGVQEDSRGFKKCFGFVEFAKRNTIEIFMKTSNLMLCGEKILCRPGNVPAQIAHLCVAAGYVFERTNQVTPVFEFMLESVEKKMRVKIEPPEKPKPKTIKDKDFFDTYFPDIPD